MKIPGEKKTLDDHMSRYTVDGRKGPFTEAIFPAVFVASPNCLCKLAVILWRLRADLSPQNCRDFEHARILR